MNRADIVMNCVRCYLLLLFLLIFSRFHCYDYGVTHIGYATSIDLKIDLF